MDTVKIYMKDLEDRFRFEVYITSRETRGEHKPLQHFVYKNDLDSYRQAQKQAQAYMAGFEMFRQLQKEGV